MNKKLLASSVLFLAVIMFLSFSTKAFAMTPVLSLAGTGDGDSVQLNVTGDPNASVILFYTKNGAGPQMPSIGTTNANGTLTTTISSSGYGVVVGSSVYIKTGGITGTQSATIAWPAVASMLSSSNMLSLSQTGLVLTLGQSATVTASNLNSSSLYLSTNSNPVIANFSASGSQITVTGISYGTTTGTFCLINNNANCGSIYVIVQNSSAQPLTFSQSSVSISSGQTIAIQISGGSGIYSVLNNNSGIVTTGISGSTISLTTTGTTGSSSITVCSTDMQSCGIINVTIGTANSLSAVSFSQSAPTMTVGQSLNISIFGPTNSLLYVASNSNPSIVQANISGNTLSLLGIGNGSSIVNVCVSASNCGSLTVTINSNSSNGGNLVLSQESIYLSTGQTGNITISGGSMPYNILSNANNIVQPNLNGNVLSLYGLSTGTSLMNVCSASGNCATLSVNVNVTNTTSTLPAGCSSTAGYSLTTGQLCSTISTSATTLPTGCLSATGYSQTTGQLCSSIPAVAVAIPTDCTGTLYSISTGQACPASTVNTTPVVTPTPAVITPTVPTPTPEVTTSTASTVFKFTKTLNLGSKGAEVSKLQQKLKTLGFYTGKIDGGFGVATEKAVKAFQKAHKLTQVGSVGPLTRALLNK